MPAKNSAALTRTLWIAFALNVLAGFFASPLTALRTVRVEGASTHYRPYISVIVRKLKGTPAMRVDPLQLESQVLASSAVRSCDFRRNVFGRGVLRIRYRTAVAALEGHHEQFLDDSGCVFRSLEKLENIPALDLFEGAISANFALVGSWPSQRVADVAKRSKKYDFGSASTIEVQAGGAVSLRTQSGTTIRLGAPYDFEEKFARLDRILESEPELFRRATSVNLTAPDRATWIPRRSR